MFNKISKEILNRAYYWTSFEPEKRAEVARNIFDAVRLRGIQKTRADT